MDFRYSSTNGGPPWNPLGLTEPGCDIPMLLKSPIWVEYLDIFSDKWQHQFCWQHVDDCWFNPTFNCQNSCSCWSSSFVCHGCYSMLWFDPHFSWLNLNVFLVCFLLVSSSLQELLGGALADGPPLILAVDGSRWCRAAEVSYDTQKPQQNNSIYGLAWKFNKKYGRHGIS